MSYSAEDPTVEWGSGTAETTGNVVEGMAEIEILTNEPVESYVGQKVYIDKDADPDGTTKYPLYDGEGQALGIVVTIEEYVEPTPDPDPDPTTDPSADTVLSFTFVDNQNAQQGKGVLRVFDTSENPDVIHEGYTCFETISYVNTVTDAQNPEQNYTSYCPVNDLNYDAVIIWVPNGYGQYIGTSTPIPMYEELPPTDQDPDAPSEFGLSELSIVLSTYQYAQTVDELQPRYVTYEFTAYAFDGYDQGRKTVWGTGDAFTTGVEYRNGVLYQELRISGYIPTEPAVQGQKYLYDDQFILVQPTILEHEIADQIYYSPDRTSTGGIVCKFTKYVDPDEQNNSELDVNP